ncbi:MAG: class I SAM-dependent methyltransferase [Chloroflexota bacterium]
MSIDPYLFGGSPRQVRNTQRRWIPVFNHSGPVLDIGCGRGIFLSMMQRLGTPVVGIDTYEPAVRACRDQGLEAHVANALSYLPSHEGAYGGIFCSHVIEHLCFEDAQRLVSLCAGALKPGGRLVLVTPNIADVGVVGGTFWLDPTHVRPYPIPLIESLVRDAGLTAVRSGTFHGGLPKRDVPQHLLYRALLGRFYGRPNASVLSTRSL